MFFWVADFKVSTARTTDDTGHQAASLLQGRPMDEPNELLISSDVLLIIAIKLPQQLFYQQVVVFLIDSTFKVLIFYL